MVSLEMEGFVAKYFENERSRGERLKKIRDEREILREILIPYKIQVSETPYFAREKVVESNRMLRELEEEERRIMNDKIFKRIYSCFFA